jgi:XTP/dITP diphosphohydrolase
MSDGKAAGAPAVVGQALLELVAVMDRLRRECPWDAKQTHASLAPYLLEETYEALEALELDDLTALREELGDVLLQVLFHARVAAERTDGTGFTIDDVAADVAAKLVRRHPHVFGDRTVSGADEVKRNWDQIKRAERAARDGEAASVLDGVPMGQPALSLAAQLLRRAQVAGAPAELAELPEGESSAGEVRAVESSAGEVRAGEVSADGSGRARGGLSEVSAVGAELFAAVAKARASGLDAELELRRAGRVFRDRVREWEQSQRARSSVDGPPQSLF